MPKRHLIPAAAIFGLSVLMAGTGAARDGAPHDGLAGPYLAARQATFAGDYRASAQYYAEALIADPGNALLMEFAMLSQIAQGEVGLAAPIAAQMDRGDANSQLASIVILSDMAKQGNFAAALAEIEKGRSVGPLVGDLFRAWALVGDGNMSDAAAAFDKITENEGLKDFALYHKALALASAGDFEGADAIFSGAAAGPLQITSRGVLAHAEILSQLERNADAVALIDAVFGAELDPGLADMRARLAAGEPLPYTMVTNATDGLAEAFYSIAGALDDQDQDAYRLSYARIAEYLRPDHVDAILLVARILEAQRQYDLATAAYNRIPRDDPSFHVAELGRAAALVSAGRSDAAIEVLGQLAKSHAGIAVVWTTLGDTLRTAERFDEAAKAYDQALALFETRDESQWVIYFTRGIAHERRDRWAEAEADLRLALELSPDQPSVLNYLGYSYLEMKTNLDEALGMIERAVAARPDDGYITDSLGWGLFLVGRYPEAVLQMEKAVALMPVDTIVNDHLGDVYWAVDRRLEAEFQWKRALSFEPETEAEAVRIRRKLEVGLDLVLKEEGVAPLALVANGNN